MDPGLAFFPATTLPQYDRDNAQAGIIAPTAPGWAFTTLTWPGANIARYSRFVPSRVMTIISIGFATTIAASVNDSCDVGIFDATGAKIVAAGSTAGKLNATAGNQSITITSTVLQPRTVYYAGFAYGAIGGTAAQLVVANWSAGASASMFGSTVGLVEASTQNTAFPLPSALGTAATTASPVLVLRES